jgi:hypothetical protein
VNVDSLLQLQAGWLAGLATLATVLVACSLHAVVQRFVRHETLSPHNEVAGVILTVIGTLDAVILGFVVVVVWQGFTTASDVVASEANAAAKVYRLARGVPGPTGSTIRRNISAYAQGVLTREWPRMMGTGQPDRQTGAIAREIANEVVDLKPATLAQANLQAAMLAAIGEFLDERRSRLTYLQPRIPGILWGVLIFRWRGAVRNHVPHWVGEPVGATDDDGRTRRDDRNLARNDLRPQVAAGRGEPRKADSLGDLRRAGKRDAPVT